MIDIVDAHHHIWRQADLAWLSGPMQPRIFGPYEPDPPRLSDPANISTISRAQASLRSVYVQTNWPNDRFERRGGVGAADRE